MVFLISFAIVALSVTGLGVGVLLGRAPLRSRCGGDILCHVCTACRAREHS